MLLSRPPSASTRLYHQRPDFRVVFLDDKQDLWAPTAPVIQHDVVVKTSKQQNQVAAI